MNMDQLKQRRYRLYQAKHRGTACSLKTELENAQLLLAWETGNLSEGQFAKVLGIDRLAARVMRDEAVAEGMQLAEAILTPNV
jgi:hypothetical protein